MTPDEAAKELGKYPYAGDKTVTIGFATLALLVERALIPDHVRADLVADMMARAAKL